MGSLVHFKSIQSNCEFNKVYKSTKRWHDKSFVLFVLPCKGCYEVGFVASKKLGNAVKRAKAKRRLRALFLTEAKQLKEGKYVLVAKPPILTTSYKELEKEFKRAVKRLKVSLSSNG